MSKQILNRKGFTMTEIMASVTIMAILAGTGVTSAVNQINDANLIATMDEMKSVSLALDEYHKDNTGNTITTISTLVTQGYLTQGFTAAPDSDLETDWKQDAWNNDYQLVPPFVEADGDYMRGSLESAGVDGVFTDDPLTTSYDESDDNIKITLEPMIAGS